MILFFGFLVKKDLEAEYITATENESNSGQTYRPNKKTWATQNKKRRNMNQLIQDSTPRMLSM